MFDILYIWADVLCSYRFMRRTGVLLLFLDSFLQEPTLLHGWIEHALLPPDYMDLSGIYKNSSATARVCATLQTKNTARDSHRSRFSRREIEMPKRGWCGGCYCCWQPHLHLECEQMQGWTNRLTATSNPWRNKWPIGTRFIRSEDFQVSKYGSSGASLPNCGQCLKQIWIVRKIHIRPSVCVTIVQRVKSCLSATTAEIILRNVWFLKPFFDVSHSGGFSYFPAAIVWLNHCSCLSLH